ncbi:hypothetical protein [Moorena producens]|uniref:hypothetical protein n=1 Tax=Moorena producens TaxID=1155739 RepID=UPI003C756193
MGETPKTALAPQDRAASLERLIPPKIGGLGGQNHTHNQQRRIFSWLLNLDFGVLMVQGFEARLPLMKASLVLS